MSWTDLLEQFKLSISPTQCTDTGPTSPRIDSIMLEVQQSSHKKVIYWFDPPRERSPSLSHSKLKPPPLDHRSGREAEERRCRQEWTKSTANGNRKDSAAGGHAE